MNRRGFCIFIDTFFQGPVPSVLGEGDRPIVYATRLEAEREIVEFAMIRLQEFLDGQRDFNDAITIEEYVVPVDVLPDGSIRGADGHHVDL